MNRAQFEIDVDKTLIAWGVDPAALEKSQREHFPAPQFIDVARRRIMVPPWRVLSLEQAGGWYTDGVLRVCTSVARELDDNHWLHVSLSRGDRIPDYDEIRRVKDLFVGPKRKALMIFPRAEEHINRMPYCLHLFSPLETDPLPDFTRGLGII